MKYSEKLVRESIGKILPGLHKAEENGVSMNLPSSLKSAACECWLRAEDVEFKLDWEKMCAGHVIRVALQELETVGWMTFGTKDHV